LNLSRIAKVLVELGRARQMTSAALITNSIENEMKRSLFSRSITPVTV
jgi:hypothetical protein